jgi:hypothetical protein
MQTANELLYSLLQVVGRIEANQRQGAKGSTGGAAPSPTSASADGSIASKLGSAIKLFASVKPKAIKSFFTFLNGMMDIAKKSKSGDVKKLQVISDSLTSMGNSLPGIAEGLGGLAKIRSSRIDVAILSLEKLYDFMWESGDGRKAKRVEKAVKLFEEMGKSLQEIAKPIKDISLGFAYLGLGILVLAGSLLLTAKLLSLSKPSDVFIFLAALVGGVLLMFGILALSRKLVDKGTDVIKDIGLGMAALSLGILSFAITIVLLPKILGSESGGSIFKSLLIMIGIVGAMALIFLMLGGLKDMTFKGFMSIVWMSAGLMVLSIAIIGLAMTAKLLMTGMTPTSATKEEKDDNKKFIMKGLGVIGLIILATVALYALIGIPAIAALVATGAGVMILLSASLILMAVSIKELVETAKELGDTDVSSTLSKLIGGTLEGFIGGLSALSGGKSGIAGIAQFIKNSAKIFAGTAVLMSMSLAISMFAKAISAFSELNNLRIIEGYDKEGKPIFGEKVNVTKVGENISTSISTFLKALIDSTEGLTKGQAKAIKKMGRALTGRRGILSAVIMFADVLKTFSQFGPDGEIGFVDMVPDGNDEDGNAKFKQVPSKVKITDVVNHIVESFTTFVKGITSHTKDFEFDGKQGKAMMELSAALVGSDAFKFLGLSFGRPKPGLLVGISKFSEILGIYAKYGSALKIPILDENGKEKGEPVAVTDIAANIMKSLTAFITAIGNAKVEDNIDKANDNLKKFDDVIDRLHKISQSVDGLSRFSMTIGELANNIGLLTSNLGNLNMDNLDKLSSASAAYLQKTNDYSVSNQRIAEASSKRYESSSGSSPAAESKSAVSNTAGTSTTAAPYKEPDWDRISASIGLAVGQQITEAMKKGQIKFEFSGAGSNKGILEIG